jgi:hypothetical protein
MEGLFESSLLEECLGRGFRIDKLYVLEEAIRSVVGRVSLMVMVTEGTVRLAEVGKLNVHLRTFILLFLS